eukprot:TRINITY_DN1921_c0_g1_i5.p1 TRINITY_DN1921_c0_g1~~TRINITY_DN1921_c0_g1_i5.p1  ORF type:complete len:247 (+),score=47.42 TRINITY_DN1921_c0_g1_i5:76-816(+)
MAGMLVFARLPDGTTVPCDVGPSSTVQDVTDMCGGSGLGRVAVLFGGKVVAGSDLLSDVGISSQSTLRITAAPELRFDRERCSEDLQIHGDDDRVVSGTTAARKELVFTTALPLPPSTGVYRWKVNVLEYVDGTCITGAAPRVHKHSGMSSGSTGERLRWTAAMSCFTVRFTRATLSGMLVRWLTHLGIVTRPPEKACRVCTVRRTPTAASFGSRGSGKAARKRSCGKTCSWMISSWWQTSLCVMR